MKQFLCFLLVSVFWISACKKKENTNHAKADCNAVKAAMINNDKTAMIAAVNAYCRNLNPVITATDPGGHRDNLEALVQMLNGPCAIRARLLCYACIKTLPPQSEIQLSVDDNGSTVSKVIDISTDPASRLEAISMHE